MARATLRRTTRSIVCFTVNKPLSFSSVVRRRVGCMDRYRRTRHQMCRWCVQSSPHWPRPQAHVVTDFRSLVVSFAQVLQILNLHASNIPNRKSRNVTDVCRERGRSLCSTVSGHASGWRWGWEEEARRLRSWDSAALQAESCINLENLTNCCHLKAFWLMSNWKDDDHENLQGVLW